MGKLFGEWFGEPQFGANDNLPFGDVNQSAIITANIKPAVSTPNNRL